MIRGPIALLFALAACAPAVRERQADEADPAITNALNDPIMADPRLELQAGGASVSVPLALDGGDHRQTLGQIAEARQRDAPFRRCDTKIGYAFAWMARLPADLALPEGAVVSEAAGSDSAQCRLRIVRFTVAKPLAVVEAYYRRSGFALSRDRGGISGVRAGAAFWVSIAAVDAATTVDFVTNRGT